MIRIACVMILGGMLTLAASATFATSIAYEGGQPIGTGYIGVYITDEVPGSPTANWEAPIVQIDGNIISVYVSPIYTSGPTTPFTEYIAQAGPVQPGGYQINFYTWKQQYGAPLPPEGYTLTATFQLTVLPFSALQRTVEYFNAERGHYFLTANPIEIALLDSGALPGWTRTGSSLWTFSVQGSIPATLSPVCRFYGLPQAGLDSHFFTANAAECLAVQELWPNAWLLESPNVFYVVTQEQEPHPITGGCPPSTIPVYRLYNNRADINHRYMTDPRWFGSPSLIAPMVAQGWILEGAVWCTLFGS